MDYSREEFERLYKASYRQMYRVAFALVEDADDAKDAVSQVFASLWQKKPQIADDRLTSYLLVAVRNQCLHLLRQRENSRLLRAELSQTDREAEEESAHRELIDELRRVTALQLSPRDREILSLHYGDDLTYAETAEALGLSPALVNKRVSHSLAVLRNKLKGKK